MIELLGVSGTVVVGVIMLVCFIDISVGQPLFVLFDEYTNPELYRTAAEKRADPDRYRLAGERALVYEIYKNMLREGRACQGIDTYWAMRKAYKERDYKALHNIYLDISCTINGDDWEEYEDDML